jgi:LAS superfamily LD-carboxypeptidase LdcB
MKYPVKKVVLPADLKGKTNGKLPTSLLLAVPGGSMHHIAAKAYLAMQKDARKAGITLAPTSSADTYRRYSVQLKAFLHRYDNTTRKSLPKRFNGKLWWLKPGFAGVAVPGESNHGWGLAIDIANANQKTLEWLLANADKYGFSWEAQSEPWHIRYYKG